MAKLLFSGYFLQKTLSSDIKEEKVIATRTNKLKCAWGLEVKLENIYRRWNNYTIATRLDRKDKVTNLRSFSSGKGKQKKIYKGLAILYTWGDDRRTVSLIFSEVYTLWERERE